MTALRVVVFTGGPLLEPDVREFLRRVDALEGVELTGCFSQTERAGWAGLAADVARRRGALAPVVLAARAARAALRVARSPVAALRRRAALARLHPRLVRVPDLHANEVLERVRALAPDLALVYGGPIVRPALFEIPRQGTLGIHHGEVPRYRGRKTFFWALHAGEPRVGVTIQRIGSALDGGDVVRAGTVRVGRSLPGAVWRRLERLGLELYVDAIEAARDGRLEAVPQSGPRGTLCREPRARDVVVFWWRTLRRIVS